MATLDELSEMIHQDLNNLRRSLFQFLEENYLRDLVEDIPVRAKIDDVEEAVVQLRAGGLESRSMLALQAMAAVSALDAQLSYLNARIRLQSRGGRIQPNVANVWHGLRSYLKNIVASISQHLWQMISQLLTLKEWAISGNTGVNLFGLVGTVQIELTFEK